MIITNHPVQRLFNQSQKSNPVNEIGNCRHYSAFSFLFCVCVCMRICMCVYYAKSLMEWGDFWVSVLGGPHKQKDW